MSGPSGASAGIPTSPPSLLPIEASGQAGVQGLQESEPRPCQQDIDGERWAIARNVEDGTVTGNVFFPDRGPPVFVDCDTLSAVSAERYLPLLRDRR